MFRVIIKTDRLTKLHPRSTLEEAVAQVLGEVAGYLESPELKEQGRAWKFEDRSVQGLFEDSDGSDPYAIVGYQDGDVVEGHEEAHARGVIDERARMAGVFSAIREEELKGERACRVPGSIDPVQEKIHRHRVEWCGDMINKIYNGCV